MRTHIKVPIKIITPKIAKNKQDSIFYAGKNIAEVKVRNRTYVLTTAGHDTKIKALGDKDLISNWGWFGINVWETRPDIPGLPPGKDQCLPYPTEVWSEYDEAMNAFIEYVEKDLSS